MRINKYLSSLKLATRREADSLIEKGVVFINGRRARLGDKVSKHDEVDVRAAKRSYRYVAFNKPRGVITHSPQIGEKEIKDLAPVPGLFPVGRLDKDSYGLIILTDDGRLTDALLNPDNAHDKEYEVTTAEKLPSYFKKRMEEGVNIEGYTTRPSVVTRLSDKRFSIVLNEGKKHQIRRMCAALGIAVRDLKRIRIVNIKLAGLRPGQHRILKGDELKQFLTLMGLN